MRLVVGLVGLGMLRGHDTPAVMTASSEHLERRIEVRLEERLQVPPRPAPAADAPARPPHVAPTETDRHIVPTAPLDVQVPVANDRRPALVVVWLGGEKEGPPRDMLTPSPPLTLHVEEVGAFYRYLRDHLID